MKILIADDDPISNKLLADSLKRWGHDVLSARDGNEAWSMLQAEDAPRLVILDWMMPGLSGVEVCQKVRALNQVAYTYLILLTSKAEKDDIVAGLKAGADDYLTKPFNPRELEVRLGVGARVLNLESNLRSALDDLKQRDQERNHFISALTHDLRTPLVAEQRALELILAGETSRLSERAQGLLKGLADNNQDLLKLVNQLLESFHASEMKITVHKEPVQLHTLVEECLNSISALAQQKHLNLQNEIPENYPVISADAEHMKRVLTNLVGNAIATIQENGTIDLSVEEQNTAVVIQVRDNGPGIPTELLPYLFERYHARSGMSRKIGSGLGLSICKTLVELQGGSIAVQSTLGEGTCFTITLPKETASDANNLSTEPLTVLVIDAQELTRIGLKATLEETGEVQVVGMTDGNPASFEQLGAIHPTVVIIGSELLIQNDAINQGLQMRWPAIRRIGLISDESPLELLQALASDVEGYCAKGSKTRHLLEALHAVAQGLPWLDPALAQILLNNNQAKEVKFSQPDYQTIQSIAAKTPEQLRKSLFHNKEEFATRLTKALKVFATQPCSTFV